MSNFKSRRRRFIGRLRGLFPTVRGRYDGVDRNKGSHLEAVYAHFDPSGIVHEYTMHQINALADSGFRVTFVTSSPQFTPDEELKGSCRQILWRYNVGYDFGSYKDGISSLGSLADVNQLVIMNDSIYGPIWPLERAFETFDEAQCDFWGITDSWQHSYHLQSYFLAFFPRAFRHREFSRFWSTLPYVSRKSWMISNGELRLTQVLNRAGLNSRSYCEYWAVHSRVMSTIAEAAASQAGVDSVPFNKRLLGRKLSEVPFSEDFSVLDFVNNVELGIPMNPTSDFWDVILKDFKSPFLKRDLLSKKEGRRPYAWQWESVLSEVSDYPLDLIRAHLKSV